MKDRPGIAMMYPTMLRERYGRYFTHRAGVRAGDRPARDHGRATKYLLAQPARHGLRDAADGQPHRRPGRRRAGPLFYRHRAVGRRRHDSRMPRRADGLPAHRRHGGAGGRLRGRLDGRVAPAAPQPPEPREALRVRVRQRPGPPAARREVQREVLRRRDALHHLRHRDDLPVPLGRDVPPARAVRARGDGGVHRARVRGLRLHLAQGRARLGRATRSPRSSRSAWRAGAPSGALETGRPSVPVERVEGVHSGKTPEEIEEEVRARRPADHASTARWAGRASSRCGPPRSGWRAARSR